MANNIMFLIRREFYALWSEKTMGVMFVALLVFTACFASLINFASLLFLLMTVYYYIQNVFSLDEKYRTELFFASLPVRRGEIVIARYGGVMVIAVVYFTLVYFVNACSMLGGKAEKIIPLGYCATALMILSVITSLTFPIYFKFGLARAKNVISFILGGTVMAGTMITMHMSEGPNGMLNVFSKALIFPSPQDFLHALFLIGIAILLLGVSILVSVALYSRRDL